MLHLRSVCYVFRASLLTCNASFLRTGTVPALSMTGSPMPLAVPGTQEALRNYLLDERAFSSALWLVWESRG